MAWYKLKPQNAGGGRKRALLNAKLSKEGQLYITHATADMLGDPERVLVEVEPEKKQIKLAPTTPDDIGGFALSGGGNASHRIRLREIVNRWPQMVGNYQPRKFANAVVFVFCEEGIFSISRGRWTRPPGGGQSSVDFPRCFCPPPGGLAATY